ncbi:MAG: gamma-glutamylcyclotransferase [Anaerolineae bacterium]|nr:gamma-glutamylcyclotransferase [Anaerolineae bacterium]
MPFELFVNGTLMRGLKLEANMGDSELLGEYRTEPHYRIHTIDDIHPGMYRLNDDEVGGVAVAGELYLVDDATWKTIEAGEPPNLYRGHVILEDGRKVYGILYPRELAEGRYPDISEYGGWREYMNSKAVES